MAEGSRVTVALAQVAPGPDHGENVERGLRLMEEARERGAGLIAFPEISFRPFFPLHRADARYFEWAEPIPGPTTDRFRERARTLGLVTVINLFERAGRGRYYDASPVIDADGTLLGVTRMVHIAEEPYFNEKFYYWPGDTGFPVYGTAVGRIGVAICYDRHFPEQMRALVIRGAELIISPFVGLERDPIDLYRVEMQGTSFSNQVYIACVNRAGGEGEVRYAGRSFVTGPSGEVVAEARGGDEELLLVELDWEEIDRWRHRRPFLRDRRPEAYGELCGRGRPRAGGG